MSQAQPDFKPGDVVIMRSGGPLMTIDRPQYGAFFCYYFHGGNLRFCEVSRQAIRHATEEERERWRRLRGWSEHPLDEEEPSAE